MVSSRRPPTSIAETRSPMFDLESLIKTIGLVGVIIVVFAETGLLIGFLLPGDSLLFTAGFLASQGYFDIHALSHGCFAAAASAARPRSHPARRRCRALARRA